MDEGRGTGRLGARWSAHEEMSRTGGIRLAASLVLMFALALTQAQVLAQKLPPTSRTVFKCEVDGKTIYSDAPCLGAQKIDVEPTRGLNKSTGRERAGADVQRERRREIQAEALRPLTGMNAKQLDTYGRRMKLTPDAQRECRRLDSGIAASEKAEKGATGQAAGDVQSQLLDQRRRFRELGC